MSRSCALLASIASGESCETCRAKRPHNPYADSPRRAERYREHQRDRLGSDPLSRLAHEWPDLEEPVEVPYSQPLRGWRLWRPVEHDGETLLCAPYRPNPRFDAAVWKRGENRASSVACWAKRCYGYQRHPSPHCWCGIRAVQSLTVLERFHKDQWTRLGRWGDLAIAEVDLWGRVVGPAPGDDWAHTLRAEKARIVGPLYVGKRVDRAPLATRYRVEVRSLHRLLKEGNRR